MKVSGFSFIRNAIKNDYPIKEAILSVLPLCDDFYIAIGDSKDSTLQEIQALHEPKIHIIETFWDDSLHNKGAVFAQETNKAFDQIPSDADWAFYIQGDECLHEKYIPLIRSSMEESLSDLAIEGFLFKYIHFYGSYDYYGMSRRWYRNEVRIIRNNKAIRSYRDAQGFRIHNQKLRVKAIEAYIYHYGWAQSQIGLSQKVKNFAPYYHENPVPETYIFDYSNADRLLEFKDSHPKVMEARIRKDPIKLSIDPKGANQRMSIRRRFLQWFEDLTGIRLGEYQNYIKL